MNEQQRKAMELALEALDANYLLVNGTETHGGLEQCLDGYYSSCFDTDPINKQTEEAITAIKEALAQPEPNYKKALYVWLDKTEWVQETTKPHELGMHRADVLKQRIQEALAQPEQEPVACVYKAMKLTEEQIWKCNQTINYEGGEVVDAAHICVAHQHVVDFARSIEREIGFAKDELLIKRINEAVLAERKACAELCEQPIVRIPTLTHGVLVKMSDVVNAIRARGQA